MRMHIHSSRYESLGKPSIGNGFETQVYKDQIMRFYQLLKLILKSEKRTDCSVKIQMKK